MEDDLKGVRELLKIERQGRVTVAKQCKCGRWFTTRQRVQARWLL